MIRTLTIFALLLAVMALNLACSVAKRALNKVSQETHSQSPAYETHSQPPTIVAQKLYDQYDQSWANHDVNQLLDFYDPSFTQVDAKGKSTGFADFRKQLTDGFNNAQFRNFNRKTVIKDVQLESGQMVVYYDSSMHYEYQDQKYGWELMLNNLSAESTWRKTGDRWKIVTSHTLRTNSGLDPQWAAMRHQELQNKLRAIQRAADSVLRPCTNSYNGC